GVSDLPWPRAHELEALARGEDEDRRLHGVDPEGVLEAEPLERLRALRLDELQHLDRRLAPLDEEAHVLSLGAAPAVADARRGRDVVAALGGAAREVAQEVERGQALEARDAADGRLERGAGRGEV